MLKRGESTDVGLLQLASGDDGGRAWETIVQVYSPLIRWWCRQSGMDEEDCEDVMQDVFITLSRHLSRFSNGNYVSFRGWLLKTTRSRIVDRVRKNRKQPTAVGGTAFYGRLVAATDSELQSSGEFCESRVIREIVRDAVETLRPEFSDSTWRAFFLTTVRSQTSTEAAHALSISPNAVRKSKARVIRRLRQHLSSVMGRQGCDNALAGYIVADPERL